MLRATWRGLETWHGRDTSANWRASPRPYLRATGGDMTGFSSFDPPILRKWLQLLKEIAPRVTGVAVIFNPDTAPYAIGQPRD